LILQSIPERELSNNAALEIDASFGHADGLGAGDLELLNSLINMVVNDGL
jgi:hypothetical protein